MQRRRLIYHQIYVECIFNSFCFLVEQHTEYDTSDVFDYSMRTIVQSENFITEKITKSGRCNLSHDIKIQSFERE